MKHFSFFLTLLLLTACTRDPESGPAPGVGQTPMQEFYIPGVFRIKLRETAAELDTRAFTRSGSGSGIAAFDAAATRAGATAVQRVFSDGDRFRERRRRAGLHLWYDVHFSGAISVAEAMERFGRVDEVECIEPVPRMVPAGATVSQADFSRTSGSDNVAIPGFDDPLLVNQWIYHRVGAAVGSTAVADLNIFPAWSVSTGHKDVVVAVVDGGIDYTHPDLAANIWRDGQGACGYNFCRHNTEITPSSHGTHVAGTIGAVNNNGIGVCGIAGGDGTPGSGVRLMSCQIFDEPGRDAATIEEIMVWTADHGAVISQNSWTYVPGLPDLSQSGKAAIDYFIKYAGCDENGNQTGPMKGGIVIFAAGNDGISDPVFPGAYEKVVAVASLGIDGRKVAGSNYGPWIDLAALGGHVTGDERFRVFSTTTNGGYGYSAGTSMAAPQVSGIAALAVAAFGVQRPGFTSEKLREILVGSGRKQFTETINPEYAGMLGNGLVDAEYVLFYDTRIRSTNVRLRFRDTAPMRNCRGVFRDAIWSVRSHHSTFTSTPGHFRPLRSTTFLLRPSDTLLLPMRVSVKLLPAESRGWNRGKFIAWQSSAEVRRAFRPARPSSPFGPEKIPRPRQPLPFRTSFCKVTTKRAGASIFNFILPMPMLRAIGSPTLFRLPRKRSWSAAYRIRNCSYGPALRVARR